VAFRKTTDGQDLVVTMEDVGKALQYANPRQSIDKIFREHRDEFDGDITSVVVSATSGNLERRARVFNLEGIALICMFSEQPIAKEFRKWVRKVAKEVLTTGTYTEPRILPAQPTEVEHLVSGTSVASVAWTFSGKMASVEKVDSGGPGYNNIHIRLGPSPPGGAGQ